MFLLTTKRGGAISLKIRVQKFTPRFSKWALIPARCKCHRLPAAHHPRPRLRALPIFSAARSTRTKSTTFCATHAIAVFHLGESVNRDRLLSSITYHHATQRPAITYKGVSAAEALIFTSYLMYRNVYWHHAVRSANAMFKRGIQDLLAHPTLRWRKMTLTAPPNLTCYTVSKRTYRTRVLLPNQPDWAVSKDANSSKLPAYSFPINTRTTS